MGRIGSCVNIMGKVVFPRTYNAERDSSSDPQNLSGRVIEGRLLARTETLVSPLQR